MAQEMTAEQQMQETLQRLRDAAPYELYDTYWVGKGASKRDASYNENFQDMILQDRLLFFQGRKSSQNAWTNQPGDRRDWAFKIAMMNIELVQLYPALGSMMTNPLDAQFLPALWSSLGQSIGVTIKIGDAADQIWESPASHIPGGSQATGLQYESSGAPTTTPATNGGAIKINALTFAEPIKMPSKSKIDVELKIGDPIKALFANADFPAPGSVEVITPDGKIITVDQWYGIRVSFIGERSVQFRGARSSA